MIFLIVLLMHFSADSALKWCSALPADLPQLAEHLAAEFALSRLTIADYPAGCGEN
jgi:hypothetical protein